MSDHGPHVLRQPFFPYQKSGFPIEKAARLPCTSSVITLPVRCRSTGGPTPAVLQQSVRLGATGLHHGSSAGYGRHQRWRWVADFLCVCVPDRRAVTTQLDQNRENRAYATTSSTLWFLLEFPRQSTHPSLTKLVRSVGSNRPFPLLSHTETRNRGPGLLSPRPTGEGQPMKRRTSRAEGTASQVEGILWGRNGGAKQEKAGERRKGEEGKKSWRGCFSKL